MENKKIILFIVILLITLPAVLAAQTAFIIDASTTSTVSNLQYVGGTPPTYYGDGISPNVDVTIRLCGYGGTNYVGGFYALNDSGIMEYALITYDGSNNKPYGYAGTAAGTDGVDNCYKTSGADLVFNPTTSYTTYGTPYTRTAAFTGYIWAGFRNSDSGLPTNWVFIPSSNGSLTGTLPTTPLVLDQSNAKLNITSIGSLTATVNSDRQLVAGVCTDVSGQHGEDCYDGDIVNDTNQFPLSFTIGLTSSQINDSAINYRRIIVNGRETTRFCIAPDLYVSGVNLNPSVGPAGTVTNITATIVNGNTNNVDVTNTFAVEFWYSGNKIGEANITGGINGGSSKTASILWNTVGLLSGSHTVTATPKDAAAGITDCNDANDNSTGQFSVELVYLPYVWIDGVQTNNFSDAGRPYNVTIQINNSNGNPSANTTIKITEVNGLSILAPLQTYTAGSLLRGVKPVSIAQVVTDDNGLVSLALIPTGNKLFLPEYSYTNVTQHVGNYSLYFEIFNQAGTELQLYTNNQKVGEFNFTLQDLATSSPNSTEQYTLSTYNQDTYVKTVLNFVYQTYATTRKWLTP